MGQLQAKKEGIANRNIFTLSSTILTVKKLTEWEPCASRPVGRPRLRWLD
jgi:hypothetical protein